MENYINKTYNIIALVLADAIIFLHKLQGSDNMDPVAFNIFGISIMWYGVIISSAILVGLGIAKYTCKYRDIDYDSMFDVVIFSIPIGFVGARLYYVAFEFDNYKNDLIQILNVRQGGLAIHGGIIFATISAILICRYKKINFFKLADVVAPSVIIAQAMGRWGNFFNQEAHGGIVSYDFIKNFPTFIQNGMLIDGKYYQPTFLYESLWNVMVFIIIIIILRKTSKAGNVFFSYIGLYSLGRVIIEGLRTDSLMIYGFRIAQLVSLTGVIISVIFFIVSNKKSKNRH